jgi:tRNA(Ile)-lysidine synthase
VDTALARVVASSEVARALEADLLPPGSRVLAACSGGADSVALAAALAARASSLSLGVVVAYVDHGLRAGSAEEAERVRSLAARIGLQFRSERLPDLSTRMRELGLEAAAREARYHALRRLAADASCDRVATAHTRRDVAETVLLRLARGAGALRGIARERPLADGIVLVRPLLAVGRDATEQLCAAIDYEPVRDAHNDDLRRARARLRASFGDLARALNPRLEEALAGAAAIAEEEDALLDEMARVALSDVARDGGLDAEALAALPMPLLRRALLHACAGVARPEREHLERLAEQVEQGRGRLDLPGGAAETAHGLLRIARRSRDPRESPAALVVDGPGEYRWGGRTVRVGAGSRVVDATRAPLPWIVRPRRPGDRFRPAGGREKKLSDLWIDAKVPRNDRDKLAVLEDARGRVFWVERLRDGGACTGAMTAPLRFEIKTEMDCLR